MKKFVLIISLISMSGVLGNTQENAPTLWSDFTAPVSTNARYITMGGILAAGLVYLNKSSHIYRKRVSYDDARPFGDYGFIGNYLGLGILNAIYIGGSYFYGKSQGSNESIEASQHMAKASIYSLGLIYALKKAVKEKRPGYPDDYDSFPSGHSSGSFSFASVIAARHGWYWGGGAYALASFIAFSRINDDYHYLHDVIFGMTIGASYGWGTYYNYKSKSKNHITLLPERGGASIALSMPF